MLRILATSESQVSMAKHLSYAKFLRDFLSANPPFDRGGWDGISLGQIVELSPSNQSRWLNDENFSCRARTIDKFQRHLATFVEKASAASLAESANPKSEPLRKKRAADVLNYWTEWAARFKAARAAYEKGASAAKKPAAATTRIVAFNHAWRPHEPPMNAMLCVAFLKQCSAETLQEIANRRPRDLLAHSANAVATVRRILEMLVVTHWGYLMPGEKVRGGMETPMVLRAMCHLLGPPLVEDAPREPRICRIAEHCPETFRLPTEEDTVAALRSADRSRVLIRALNAPKFAHGTSQADYPKERKWRPVYVYAAPILVRDGTGPMGVSAGVLTLDVLCHQETWRKKNFDAAVAAVKGTAFQTPEQTKRIERAMTLAAGLTQEVLMPSSVDPLLEHFHESIATK